MTIKISANKLRAFLSRRVLFVMYTIVIIIVSIGFINLLSFRMLSSLNLAEESLRSVKMSINNTSKDAVDHVRILQTEAKQHLLERPPESPSKLFSALKPNTDGKSYSVQTLPPDYIKTNASYVVGGGHIPAPDSQKAQEIEVSLKLNPLFSDVKKNIADCTWVYYYSANYFINMYPFEPQALLWSDDWMTHPLFKDTQPDKNPTRAIRWHDVYMDEAGKGLMTSVVAPVFDGEDHFRAMVGIDITLNSLSNHLTGPGLGIGTPLLVDQHGHILSHLIENHSSDTVVSLHEMLPAGLQEFSETLLVLEPGSYHDLAGWKVIVMDIDYSPWKLIFLVDQAQLRWQILGNMWVEIIGIMLLVIIIFGLEQRHRMAKRLLTFKAAVDSSSAAIFIVDNQSVIKYVNNSFVKVTGYSADEAIGSKMSILKSEQTQPEVYHELWDTVLSGKSCRYELLNRRKNGTLYWGNILISPVSSDNEDNCFVVVMEDITERKHMQEMLHDYAIKDSLTGVFNRRHFMEVLQNEFRSAGLSGESLSLLMIDIDYFKPINDTYGHASGDLVLQHFTSQCLALIRPQDCMVRLGGEEFAILLRDANYEQAHKTGERIRKSIEQADIEVLSGVHVKITCSIGIAQNTEVDVADDMLLRADSALYEAKRSGRNRVCGPNPSI